MARCSPALYFVDSRGREYGHIRLLSRSPRPIPGRERTRTNTGQCASRQRRDGHAGPTLRDAVPLHHSWNRPVELQTRRRPIQLHRGFRFAAIRDRQGRIFRAAKSGTRNVSQACDTPFVTFTQLFTQHEIIKNIWRNFLVKAKSPLS